MISLPCAHCHKILAIDEAFAGGVCRCQHCGTIQTVPAHFKTDVSQNSSSQAKALYRHPRHGDSHIGPAAQNLRQETLPASGSTESRSRRAADPGFSGGPRHHKPLTWRAWIALGAVVLAGALLIYLLLTCT